jgi:hypothetical protein
MSQYQGQPAAEAPAVDPAQQGSDSQDMAMVTRPRKNASRQVLRAETERKKGADPR